MSKDEVDNTSNAYVYIPLLYLYYTLTKSLHESNGLGLTIGPTLGPKTQSIKSMDLDMVNGLSQHLWINLWPKTLLSLGPYNLGH